MPGMKHTESRWTIPWLWVEAEGLWASASPVSSNIPQRLQCSKVLSVTSLEALAKKQIQVSANCHVTSKHCLPLKWTSTIFFFITCFSKAPCQGLIKNNPVINYRQSLEQISWDETLASIQHSQHSELLLCQWFNTCWAFWIHRVLHMQ